MIDAAQLGGRLRTLRERRGLSQRAVADALELPRTAVTNMESGRRAVSTLELAKLAEVYVCLPADFLVADEESGDLFVVLHRSLPEIRRTPKIEFAVHRSLDLCREGAILRGFLDRKTESAVPDRAMPATNAREAIGQGEAVAQEERGRLGLGNAPIRNVAGLISGQGIWTAATEMPIGMSGLFINHASVGLAILANRDRSPSCRRFSYSREYAHALFDRSETVTATKRKNSSELVEKRANAFATAFLMPPAGVDEQLARIGKGRSGPRTQIVFDAANDATVEADIRSRPGSRALTCQDAALLARHFGVSFEAAAWRLRNLGYLGAGETAALIDRKEIGNEFVRLSSARELLDEDAPAEASEPEFRSQLLELAIEAFRREEISRGRLVEIGKKLAIQADEIMELAYAVCAD